MPAKSTKSKSNPKKKSSDRLTAAQKAGITFPPTRCTRLLRKNAVVDRVSAKAGVLLASVLEGLLAELAEAAGDVAKEQGNKRIKPRHIMLAVKADDQLSDLFGSSTISNSGVIPNLHPTLETTGRAKKKRQNKEKVSDKADKKAKAKADKQVKA